jgi:hypothetical protein
MIAATWDIGSDQGAEQSATGSQGGQARFMAQRRRDKRAAGGVIVGCRSSDEPVTWRFISGLDRPT